MQLVETDHMICFNQSHGLFGTRLPLCRSTLLNKPNYLPAACFCRLSAFSPSCCRLRKVIPSLSLPCSARLRALFSSVRLSARGEGENVTGLPAPSHLKKRNLRTIFNNKKKGYFKGTIFNQNGDNFIKM